MPRPARHLFHYRSELDRTDQPYLVSAPVETPRTGRLPILFVLHDTLAEPTPEGFLEAATAEAARWDDALSESRPAVLAFPFGRGNAGWLGAGGRDLFDVWEELADKFPLEDKAALAGIGAGATGALQLATWFPDRFSAVAAVGAWTSEREDLPLGAREWPAWERTQRRAVSPARLACNLAGLGVYLEHPWWIDGADDSASPSHLDALVSELVRFKIPFHRSESDRARSWRRESPSDRHALLEGLLWPPALAPCDRFRFKTYSTRSTSKEGIRIDRITDGGLPSIVRARVRRRSIRLKTRGVDAISLQPRRLLRLADRLRLDEQWLDLHSEKEPTDHWISFERTGRQWTMVAPDSVQTRAARPARLASGGGPPPSDRALPARIVVKGPRLGGPAMDLRWGAAAFVPGTLGDEADNLMLRDFAEGLRRRWTNGEDSIHPHPGDRTASVEYPLVADADLTDAQSRRCHLVVIGHPRNHLLLARMRSALPCRWDGVGADPSAAGGFQIAGRTYRDPRDVAFFVAPNPEEPGRYLLVITANAASALASARRVTTAFLPDYLVHRGERVLDWGYFGADWRSLRE